MTPPFVAHTAGAAAVPAAHGHELVTVLAGGFVFAVGALVVGVAVAQVRGGLSPSRGVPFERWMPLVAAPLSLGAGAIHFAVIGEHFAAEPAYGLAFAIVAWFQTIWAVAYAVRPSRALAAAALLANLGVSGAWAVSRAIGLPFGPEIGRPEAVGPLDALGTLLEVALVALLAVVLLPALGRLRRALPQTSAALYVGSAVLAVAFSSSVAFGIAAGTHGGEQVTATAVGSSGAATPAGSVDGASGRPAVGSSIAFGRELGADGGVTEVAAAFGPGDVAAWSAELSRAPDGSELALEVVEVLDDGREVQRWSEHVDVVDPDARRVVSAGVLGRYAGDRPGWYVMRYVVADEVVAEGAFRITG